MDLTLIDVCEAGGGGWVRGSRYGDDGRRETLAELVGDQAAEGRDQGSVRVAGVTVLWQFTPAAGRKREAAARAEIARRVRAERRKTAGAVEWLQSDEGQVLVRVAGWQGLGAREVVEMLAGGPRVGA